MSEMDTESEREPLLNRHSRDNISHHTSGDVVHTTTNESGISQIRSEFRCHNIRFVHNREDVFYSCQWDWPPIIFVLYRLMTAGYTFTILLVSILFFDDKKWLHYPWPVWLTNWSFFLLTAYFLVSACVVVLYSTERGRCCQTWSLRSSVYSFLPDSSTSAIPANPLPWYIKLQWLLYSVAAPSAFVVTIVFFSALYPQMNPSGGLDFGNGTLHMSNSLLVLCEMCLCALPVRLLHGVYFMLYGLIYAVFSIVYWSMDHTHVLYPIVLDWNHPATTSGIMCILCLVGVPFIQLMFFLAYKLRIRIYKAIYGSYSF